MLNSLMKDITKQVNTFLTERCTISKEVAATDEFGSPTHMPYTVATNVHCRLIRGDKVRLADFGLQETNRVTYRLIVKADQPLEKGQQISIDASRYDVLGIRQNLTDSVFGEALVGKLE